MSEHFLDEIADLMSSDTSRIMSRKTGLSREKIRRITKAMSFVVDWKFLTALDSLGYRIALYKKTGKNAGK